MTSKNTEEPEALFEQLVADFSTEPAVAPPSSSGGKFGASALKVDGKIFAMLRGGSLVVKLPRRRVDELLASGTGTRFESGHGRVMNEWVSVDTSHGRDWAELAREGLEFVAATPSTQRRRST